MDLDQLKVSKEFEEGGWIGELPNLPGVEVKVRNTSSATYQHAQSRRIDTVPRSMRARGLSFELSQSIQVELLLKVVLLDWRGITSKGEPLPYDEATAKRLLESPVFRDAVTFAAGIVGLPWEQSGQSAPEKAPEAAPDAPTAGAPVPAAPAATAAPATA